MSFVTPCHVSSPSVLTAFCCLLETIRHLPDTKAVFDSKACFDDYENCENERTGYTDLEITLMSVGRCHIIYVDMLILLQEVAALE